MKILNKILVSPILIHKAGMGFNDKADIVIRWRKSKTAGTVKTVALIAPRASSPMRNTSYTLQIIVRGRPFQWTFVWRPEVTRYWWRHSRYKT